MTSQYFFLAAAIICLLLFILSSILSKTQTKEYFNPSPSPSISPTNPPCPVVTCSPPMSDIWWMNEPPKQIVSLISGISFPVIAKTPANSINSDFQIPFIQYGSVQSSGCIAIDENIGTYTTKVCNKDDNTQLWSIVPVRNESDLRTIIQKGQNRYSMLRGDDTTIELPSGVQYGFFMVISKSKDGSFALASNGGNITVQTVGNFTSQFWDITRDTPNASIAIYDTEELLNHINPSNPQDQITTLMNPLVPLNAQAGDVYQTVGMGAIGGARGGNSKELNLNLNLNGGDILSALFGGLSQNETDAAGSEGFNLETIAKKTKNCPACPSILTDYISKNNIPCYGCNL
jgi:hypothetical protein